MYPHTNFFFSFSFLVSLPKERNPVSCNNITCFSFSGQKALMNENHLPLSYFWEKRFIWAWEHGGPKKIIVGTVELFIIDQCSLALNIMIKTG